MQVVHHTAEEVAEQRLAQAAPEGAEGEAAGAVGAAGDNPGHTAVSFSTPFVFTDPKARSVCLQNKRFYAITIRIGKSDARR
jgi:hypothetical protein